MHVTEWGDKTCVVRFQPYDILEKAKPGTRPHGDCWPGVGGDRAVAGQSTEKGGQRKRPLGRCAGACVSPTKSDPSRDVCQLGSEVPGGQAVHVGVGEPSSQCPGNLKLLFLESGAWNGLRSDPGTQLGNAWTLVLGRLDAALLSSFVRDLSRLPEPRNEASSAALPAWEKPVGSLSCLLEPSPKCQAPRDVTKMSY